MSDTANHFSLQGHNVSIDYSLSDLQGHPSLNFKVDSRSGTVRGKDIHLTKMDIGTLVSIALHPGPSADDDPRFSFMLPDVTLQAGHESNFDTTGFQTVISRLGPVHQHYTVVALKGKASLIKTLQAHG